MFEKSEAQCDALRRACEKLHPNENITPQNNDEILSNYRHNHPHLIFIDARHLVEILRNAETYSPTSLAGSIPPLKTDDQLTNDLLTGLIHSNKSSGVRRMSHEQVVQKRSSGVPQSPLSAQPPVNLANVSDEVRKFLEQQWDWEFSIIDFEQITNKR